MKKKARCHRLTNLPVEFRKSQKCSKTAMVILDEIIELYRVAKSKGEDSFCKPNSYFMEVVGLSETSFTNKRKELIKLGIVEVTLPSTNTGRITRYHVHPEKIDEGCKKVPNVSHDDSANLRIEDLLKGEILKPYNKNENVEKNRFYVSNMARCWDVVRGRFIEEQGSSKSDYLFWFLTSKDKDKDYRNKRVFIHRAVAELFVEIPEELKGENIVVDHIDGHKKNNEATNLRWLTYSENAKAQDVQERKVASFKRTLNEKKIEQENQELAKRHRELSELVENSAKRNVEYLARAEEAERKEFEAMMRVRKLEAELERANQRANQLGKVLSETNNKLTELQESYQALSAEYEFKDSELKEAWSDVQYFSKELERLHNERDTFKREVLADATKMVWIALHSSEAQRKNQADHSQRQAI